MVPVETSSGYLANERTLLPEDAVCFFFSFENLYGIILFYHENDNYFHNFITLFCGTLPFYIFDKKFCSSKAFFHISCWICMPIHLTLFTCAFAHGCTMKGSKLNTTVSWEGFSFFLRSI
jgi:hypothetical protein